MKRGWLGVALLIVLLIAGVVIQLGMDSLHRQSVQTLEQAAEASLAENWEQAETLALQARESWYSCYRLTASVADHAPMDEIDRLYGELLVYLRQRETVHFAATCAQLARMTHAMGEAHRFSFGNLL